MSTIDSSITYTILAYHIAVFKGTDVDQPRNLAKSVTVEYCAWCSGELIKNSIF